jgi:hypothetical protein
MAIYTFKVMIQVDNGMTPAVADHELVKALETNRHIHGHLVVCVDDKPNLFDVSDDTAFKQSYADHERATNK